MTDILSIPMLENDTKASTVGEYLSKLLCKVWNEAENFSGKRPFGNSSWQYEVYDSLAAAGVIDGLLVDDEWDYDYEQIMAADKMICEAIRKVFLNE